MKCIRIILSAFISEQIRDMENEMCQAQDHLRAVELEKQRETDELEALKIEFQRVTKELGASNGTVTITVHTSFSCPVDCRIWQTWLTHIHSYVVEPC